MAGTQEDTQPSASDEIEVKDRRLVPGRVTFNPER